MAPERGKKHRWLEREQSWHLSRGGTGSGSHCMSRHSLGRQRELKGSS